MPELCRFYGIIIRMHIPDHEPPHFHALYSGQEALVEIDSLSVIRGRLPTRALRLVTEWASLHGDELWQTGNVSGVQNLSAKSTLWSDSHLPHELKTLLARGLSWGVARIRDGGGTLLVGVHSDCETT